MAAGRPSAPSFRTVLTRLVWIMTVWQTSAIGSSWSDTTHMRGRIRSSGRRRSASRRFGFSASWQEDLSGGRLMLERALVRYGSICERCFPAHFFSVSTARLAC